MSRLLTLSKLNTIRAKINFDELHEFNCDLDSSKEWGINWSPVRGLLIHPDHWESLLDNIVILEHAGDYFLGKVNSVSDELITLSLSDNSTDVQFFFRRFVDQAYAIETTRGDAARFTRLVEFIDNNLELAMSGYLFECLTIGTIEERFARENPDEVINRIDLTIRNTGRWITEALSHISGKKRVEELNVLKDLLTLLLSFEDKPLPSPIVKKAIRLKKESLIECLNEVNRQIGLRCQPSSETAGQEDNDDYWNGKKNRFNPPMSLGVIDKWFMQLANTKSKNGNPFLTVDQVQKFIERAFTLNTDVPIQTFNLANGERTSIEKLFYLYYEKCKNDYTYEPTKHSKAKYVRLLTDNFTNYNFDTVFKKFNNSQAAPIKWDTTI
ncbi:hypothetical protein [Spirosoma areae]